MAGTARAGVATRAGDRARHDRARRDRIRHDRGVGLLTAGVMGALVVLVYAAAVGVGALFGRTGPPGLGVSVVATAVVALAFEPVRARTRGWIERLTHHQDRSLTRVLAGFNASVAGRYPIARLPQCIAAVVGEGTGARRTEVWLMVNDRMELAARWAADGTQPASDEQGTGEARGADAARTGESRHRLEVRDRGELLGELIVITAADHHLTTVERRLVEGLAAQSGLLLRVAGLRVELQRRLADLQQRSTDLRRARRDLVARQDAERKRLERNIHDGAQQEVIALLVNLRLVQTLLARAPDRAMGLVAAQTEATRSTMHTLQELSHGLYPQVLGDDGPVAALQLAARRSPVQVSVTADPLPRLPADIEATLYFCGVEALQNAAKHSSATEIRIAIRTGPDGALRVEIGDDGVGFDPDRMMPGRGLANIRDRVESVGGHLRLTSEPGAGTRLDLEIPLTPRQTDLRAG